MQAYEMEYYSKFESAAECQRKETLWSKRTKLCSCSIARSSFLDKYSILNHQIVGFKLRAFRSHETIGNRFFTGSRVLSCPPSRSGDLETDSLTQKAKTKIRRASENATSYLRYFCTLTFSPALVDDDNKDDQGNICHKWAKTKIRQFLDTCRHQQKRLNRTLSYIWVAELQKNGNIHFHIIWNQFFQITWLTKIWGQASNSVDIKTMKNITHAINYMRKYISKDDQGTIKGNRYNISKELRETMKPIIEENVIVLDTKELPDNPQAISEVMEFIDCVKEDIEERGGTVLDFGFYIPPDRTNRDRKKRFTSKQLSRLMISSLLDLKRPCANIPF
jgi:SepF-like predicted cell division protein (DUF552 family)